jgi:hypothetical protein
LDGAGQLSPYFPPRHTTSVLEGPLHVDSDVPTFISRNQPVESLTVSPYENFLLSEAVIEAEMQVQGAKDKEVGAVSHLGPAHDTNIQTKRKRSSRKIDAVDTETLTQERLSEETNNRTTNNFIPGREKTTFYGNFYEDKSLLRRLSPGTNWSGSREIF